MSNRPKFTAAILAFFLIICFTFSWLFSHVFSENARFLNLFGIRDAAVTAEIYRYITETPANYLKYYVGYLNFLDLKEEQQSLLGENFDLKSFHQKILEIGPVQFPVLRKYMNEKL